MKRLTKMFKGGQKGFTLIELLIVIVILGVLAAAIIPNLSRFIGSGTVGSANAELASVRTGVAAYQSEHDGALPVSSDGTGAVVAWSATTRTVVNDAINTYITGSAGIKGLYTVNSAGQIIFATPLTTGGWTGIQWEALITATPPGSKWIKSP